MLRDRKRILLCISAVIAATLAACAKQDGGELAWARAALERNPQVKVLSIDAAKNTIQIRVKETGETLNVAPGELAALPIGELVALTSASHAVQTAAAPAPAQSPPLPETPTPVAETPVEAPVQSAPPPPTAPAYKVERQDGQVRVTGPGVSIESHPYTAKDVAASGSQHFDEPIICEGKRMMHLDGRRINVNGDAIIARGGCELHITNSQINATGVGVGVLDATVHISNSQIHGDGASLDASGFAKLILRNTTFQGVARRDPQAQIQDQGGNSWH
jgi:hypothetical protein